MHEPGASAGATTRSGLGARCVYEADPHELDPHFVFLDNFSTILQRNLLIINEG